MYIFMYTIPQHKEDSGQTCITCHPFRHIICTSCSDISVVKSKTEGVKGREWWHNVFWLCSNAATYRDGYDAKC